MKFVSLTSLAKELNVDELSIKKEIYQVISELPTTHTYYLLHNPDNSSPKILAITKDEVSYILSGVNGISFLDLVTHFDCSANDMVWVLEELTNRGIINQVTLEFYIRVRDKPFVHAYFDPSSILMGKKSTLNIEINTPREIQEPKIVINYSAGLNPEEKPKALAKIFKGRFVEKYVLETSLYGNLQAQIGLAGYIDGAYFGNEPYSATLNVLPLPPELVISENQTNYEAAYQGVFRFTLDITNRGSGAAQNVELQGLENHFEFEVVEPTKIGNIATHGSVKYKMALKPKKSGTFLFNDLTVIFEDLAGKRFSASVPEFEIQVVTPQPKLKVEFAYPESIEPQRVFPLSIRITNIGEGEARNITFMLPIDHRHIQSGIVDCNITKLKSNESEELLVRLQAPENGSLDIPDLSIRFDDSEDNNILQKVFGVAIPVLNRKTPANAMIVDHTSIKWPFVENARIGGQYHIIEQIGEGGYAKVYRVRRQKFNEEWALKALKAEYVTIPSFEEGFVEEARIAQKLREDHIIGVQYVDVQTEVDLEFPYIIMEYIKGGTLRDKLKEPMDLMTSAEIMKDICSALLYAHQQGVIHFDVKPSNIFYDDTRKLWKLGDFGLSKPITTSNNVTPRGSLPYMAPELKQRRGNSKSDIYSLGRVCTEILTGSPDGDLSKAEDNYPRESKLKVKEFAAITEKMLNANPTERPTIVEIQKVFLKSTTWSGNERRRAI